MFHQNLIDSTQTQGLWATTWLDSALDSKFFVKSFQIRGRLFPTEGATRSGNILLAPLRHPVFGTQQPQQRQK